MERIIAEEAELRAGPSNAAEPIRSLTPGESFRMLEDSVGWAWGYAGSEGRVGYIRSEALTKP